MIFELHENQTGQQQHSQSSSWFQAVSFHSTVLYTHTLTHTRTRTHQHAQGFSTPPHSNLLPVWELSSSRLDWQKLNKLPCRSASFVSISPTADGASACPGQSSSRRHPARTFRSYPPPDPSHQPPTPGSPCAFDPAAGARLSACRFRRAAPSSVWSSPLSPLR